MQLGSELKRELSRWNRIEQLGKRIEQLETELNRWERIVQLKIELNGWERELCVEIELNGWEIGLSGCGS